MYLFTTDKVAKNPLPYDPKVLEASEWKEWSIE